MSTGVRAESKAPSFALVNCAQLVTLSGPRRPRVLGEMRELAIIKDGALLVESGSIAAVGAQRQIESMIKPDTTVLDAGGRVVLPGFVDAHTHLIFAGNRADEFEQRCAGVSYREIAERGGGIRSTVQRTRAATQEELVAIGQRHASWFLRGGTTTIEAKSGYGLTTDDELKLLRAIAEVGRTTPLNCVPTFLGAHEVPDEFRGRPAEYTELLIREMLPAVTDAGLAQFCDVFCEPHIFDVGMTEQILTAARRYGLGLRMHADQFSCSGAALLAARLGTATADHLEHTDADGIAALSAAHVQPVLLPGSVYAIGSTHYPSARTMIDAGLGVVIATDFNPGSSPTTSMTMILSLACTQMKMTPAEAITAATINAAYSLRLGGSVGSLEPGKSADIVVHDAADYREIAYFFGDQRPVMVFTPGERVV